VNQPKVIFERRNGIGLVALLKQVDGVPIESALISR
jgi:hypothetical protein